MAQKLYRDSNRTSINPESVQYSVLHNVSALSRPVVIPLAIFVIMKIIKMRIHFCLIGTITAEIHGLKCCGLENAKGNLNGIDFYAYLFRHRRIVKLPGNFLFFVSQS